MAFKDKIAQTAKDQQRAREKQEKSLSKRRAQVRRQALRVAKRIQKQNPKGCEDELNADDEFFDELMAPSACADVATNQEMEVDSNIYSPILTDPSPSPARLPRLTQPFTLFAAPELLLGRTCRKKVNYPKPIVYGGKAPKSRLVVIKPTSNVTYGNLLHPPPNPAANFFNVNAGQRGLLPEAATRRPKKQTKYTSPTRRHNVEGPPEGRFLQSKNMVLDLSGAFAPLGIRGLPPARQSTYGYVYI